MYSSEEFLICVLARLIEGARHVAVGAASPIPGAAALLCQALAPAMRVTLLHSRRYNRFTDGGRELFDCAGQGRIDRFFLGGVQIDGEANINLVGTGGYPRSEKRFPGSFGSAYLYFVVPKVILFREEHSRRVLVPKVDFISAPGWSPANVYRPGGPYALVTNRCVFLFDRERRRFRLHSVHPGHSLEEVRNHTGFPFDCQEQVPITPAPEPERLALLRASIGAQVAEAYPEFAQRVFAASV
jgi:glutaconate CoA-transferase subunit B